MAAAAPPRKQLRRHPATASEGVKRFVRRKRREAKARGPPALSDEQPALTGEERPAARNKDSVSLGVIVDDAQAPAFWVQVHRKCTLWSLRQALQRHCESEGLLRRRRWRFSACPSDAAANEAEFHYLQALEALDMEYENIDHVESMRDRFLLAGGDLTGHTRRRDAFAHNLLRVDALGKEVERMLRVKEVEFSVLRALPRVPHGRLGLPSESFTDPFGLVPCGTGARLGCVHVQTIDRHCAAEQVMLSQRAELRNKCEANDHASLGQWIADALPSSSVGSYLLLNARDELSGTTPLHMAARRGQERIVAELLKAGALGWVRDLRGRTPLHEAAEKGHANVVFALLRGVHKQTRVSSGGSGTSSSPGASDEEDSRPPDTPPSVGLSRFPVFGCVAAARAARRRLAQAVTVTDAPPRKLAEPYAEMRDRKGLTAMVLVSQGRHQAALRVLFDAGALDRNPKWALSRADQYGVTLRERIAALACPITAAAAGHIGVLAVWYDRLAWKAGDTEKLSGGTLLHWAAAHGRAAVCRYLVAERKEDPGVYNDAGLTPVHEAALRNDIATVDAMLSAAGREREEGIARQITRNSGKTLIHLALGRPERRTDKFCLRVLRCSSRWDFAQTDCEGKSILHASCSASRPAILREVIDRLDYSKPESSVRSLLNGKDRDGLTPLGCCIAAGSATCAGILLEHPLVSTSELCSAQRAPLLLAVESRALPRPQAALPLPVPPSVPLGGGIVAAQRPNSAARKRILSMLVLDSCPDAEVARVSGVPGRAKTPLHAAVAAQDYDMVSALLARRADTVAHDCRGVSPLAAVSAMDNLPLLRCVIANARQAVGSPAVVEAVLAANGPSSRDSLFVAELVALTLPNLARRGPSLLLSTCTRGQFNAAKVLLDVGCPLTARRPSSGSHRSLAKLPPLSSGARPTEAQTPVGYADALVAALSVEGDAPLETIAETLYLRGAGRCSAGPVAALAARRSLWGVLRRAAEDPACRWDMSAVCSAGRNCLHYACMRGPVGEGLVVRLARAAGKAAVQARDSRGVLPFEYALVRPAPLEALALLSVSSPQSTVSYQSLCAKAVALGVDVMKPPPMPVDDAARVEEILATQHLQIVGGVASTVPRLLAAAAVPSQRDDDSDDSAVRLRLDCPKFERKQRHRSYPQAVFDNATCGGHALSRHVAAAVRRLSQKGGRDCRPDGGETLLLLHWSCSQADGEMLQAVLDAQRMTRQEGLVNARAPQGGEIAPHMATALYVAAALGRSRAVESLLDVPGVDVDAATVSGETPLGAALRQGCTDIAMTLVSHGACPAVSATARLLHRPPWKVRREVVVVGGLSPLAALSRNCWQLPTVALLAKLSTAMRFPTELPHQPLTISGSPCSVVQLFLGAMPRPPPPPTVVCAVVDALACGPGGTASLGVNRTDPAGRSALECCLVSGFRGLATHLITNAGARPWHRMTCGRLPVHVFCRQGHLPGLKACLKATGSPADICSKLAMRDRGGMTALHNALLSCSADRAEMVRLLIWHSAPLDAVDSQGRSVLMTAARSGMCAAVMAATEPSSFPNVESEVSARDGRGRTALHHAAACGHPGDVDVLLGAGSALAARTTDPLAATPLAMAALAGHSDAALALLAADPSAGAEAAPQTATGDTVLHLAAVSGLRDVAMVAMRAAAETSNLERLMVAETSGTGLSSWDALSPLAVALCFGGMPHGRRLGAPRPRDQLTQTLWRHAPSRSHRSVAAVLRLVPRYRAEVFTRSPLAHYAFGDEGCVFMTRGIPLLRNSLTDQMWRAVRAGDDKRLLKLLGLGDFDGRSVQLSQLPLPSQAARAKRIREGASPQEATDAAEVDSRVPGRAVGLLRQVIVQELRPYHEIERIEWPEQLDSPQWDRSVVVVLGLKSEATRLHVAGRLMILDRWPAAARLLPPRGPQYRDDFEHGKHSIIHAAASAGCLGSLSHIVKVNAPQQDVALRESFKKVLQMLDQHGYTALHYACAKSQHECAALLISCGASYACESSGGLTLRELMWPPARRMELQQALVQQGMSHAKTDWLAKHVRAGFYEPVRNASCKRRPTFTVPGPADPTGLPAPAGVFERFVDGDTPSCVVAKTDYKGVTGGEGPAGKLTIGVLRLSDKQLHQHVEQQRDMLRRSLFRTIDGIAEMVGPRAVVEVASAPGLQAGQPPASVDLAALLQRVREHVAALPIAFDAEGAEELPTRLRSRALTLLRYSCGGGALGRELYLPLRRLICDRGVYGLQCVLLIKRMSVLFSPTRDGVRTEVTRAEGRKIEVATRVYCDDDALVAANVSELVDGLFGTAEVVSMQTASGAARGLAKRLAQQFGCGLAVYADSPQWKPAAELPAAAADADAPQVLRLAGDRDTGGRAAECLAAAAFAMHDAACGRPTAMPHPLRQWLRQHRSELGSGKTLHLVLRPAPVPAVDAEPQHWDPGVGDPEKSKVVVLPLEPLSARQPAAVEIPVQSVSWMRIRQRLLPPAVSLRTRS
eukprot:TRINITY_DN4171_c0_g2_i1.p1 TRINITY_DN4171_c0_g2~~TRINITY_DN4171_c0_g2_i1.p1  ORF type:complete len:2720 (+),score=715.15 TRINITY_DN4171_c0_g2_i1:697-8160(+)